MDSIKLGKDAKITVIRGTLTILSDTHVILYLPYNAPLSPQENEGIKEWLKNGGVLQLPMPVDVIDMRKPKANDADGFDEPPVPEWFYDINPDK